jgi:hypothetical protein
LSLALLFSVFPALAAPPRPRPLSGIPDDPEKAGDAFVAAWLTLREDFNSLSHGGVHARQLNAWLDAAPRFLLRDILRHAREPVLLWHAGRALANGADDRDRALLHALSRHYADAPLGFVYEALRVAAGDADATKDVAARLEDAAAAVRFAAASTLGAAGDARGMRALAQHIQQCDPWAAGAAQVLGRFGGTAELALLTAPEAVQCLGPGAESAAGEIHMRRLFPELHMMMERRDPVGMHFATNDGIYTTWSRVIAEAVARNVTSLPELERFVNAYTLVRAQWQHQPEGVVNRRIAELRIFVKDVLQTHAASRPEPEWPANFAQALQRVEAPHRRAPNARLAFSQRISAAVLLLRDLHERLHHERHEDPGLTEHALFADAERLTDNHLATHLRVAAGQSLTFAFAQPESIGRIWLANTCTAQKGAAIESIEVTGTTREGKETAHTLLLLSATRYYQPISVSLPKVVRLTITVGDIAHNATGPACIAELRIERAAP